MHYASPKHERLYRNVARGRGYKPHTLAALFLLTAHRKLWRKWCKAIDNKGLDWTAGNGLDPGWDGDALQAAALSIQKSQAPQVTLHQLADPIEYPQELLRLVITALWIARNDPKATREIMIKKEGRLAIC